MRVDIISLVVSFCAAVVSAISLWNSVLAKRQAGKIGALPQRFAAIEHIRIAYGDVILHAHIDDKTVAHLREAYQLSKLVFSKSVSEKMEEIAGTAFQLANKPFDKKTVSDLDKEHALGDELQDILEAMLSEAALNNRR